MLGLPPPRNSGGEPSHRDRTRQGMLTKSWRRKPGQVLAVATVVLSLSGLAQAQQSGLFPLHPIKRERVPCPEEDPIYKLYRSQYYGYYPTQWRPFPQGWSLKSPEGPNTKQALKDNPIEAPKPPEGGGEGEEGPAGPDRGGQQPIPTPPPDDRSPFEMDKPDNGAAGAGARRPAAAPNTPAPAGPEPSPFDMPADAGAAPAPRPRAPQPNAPAPAAPGPGAPGLDLPGAAPAAPVPPRTSRTDDKDEAAGVSDRGPLLAMPDATLPTIEEASRPGAVTAVAVADPVLGRPGASAPVATQAAQPAPRRSLLSSLFGGTGFNWLRR